MAKPVSPELDDAIAAIVGLMLSEEWEPGSSHLAFAKRYGVTVATVRDWASHASRFIRLCAGNDEEIRDELLRNIRRIGSKAEAAGDNRHALAAQELRLRVHGLLERKPDATEELTEEQLDAQIRARGYRKDTDATEPAAETRARRGSEDSEGEPRAAREGSEEE
jgi:hypothetical protein